ncbi:MAG: hypothetical protein RID09_06560 [Coleofasciculus sp. G1-WW12-02]|uniref:hypothetical protein n=1 Tax=unclassified Coleofasciculus TaxID=2692782 RepID=UPI003304F7F5
MFNALLHKGLESLSKGRNLSQSNGINLLPEAQEQILEEADELLNVLPFPHKQRLKTFLERIRDCFQYLSGK